MRPNLSEKLLEEALEIFQTLPLPHQYKSLGYSECLAAVAQAEEAKKLPTKTQRSERLIKRPPDRQNRQ